MSAKLVIIGAGGHARVLAEILQITNEFTLAGFTDPDPKLKDSIIQGAPIFGPDEILPELLNRGIQKFIIGVGSTGNNGHRSHLFRKILEIGLQPVTIIHPTAVISPRAVIGGGTAILPRAIVNNQAQIGENVIINSGAIIEHDCVVGDHCHVASGACLSGGVRVGSGSFIGAGASVIQNIRIGRGCVIGAGAAVVRDIPDQRVAMGVPARIQRSEKEPIWKV
jgi:sugar O-acyltransferase (sialic acid O-acetyltransferase NeuD family)